MSDFICERHRLRLSFFNNISNLNRVAEDWTIFGAIYTLFVEAGLDLPWNENEFVCEFDDDAEK